MRSAGLMVRPRRAEPVARPVRGVWVLGWRGGAWGGAVLGVGDVLCVRGLRSPPGHWGLNAVIWGRSTSPADIAVLDVDGWLLTLECGGASWSQGVGGGRIVAAV